jgi:cysteinyl-tRNA synthetase
VAEVPDEVLRLRDLREERRQARDFLTADVIRAQIRALGFEVHDTPTGPLVESREAAESTAELEPGAVESVLGEPATLDATVCWIVQGWPEDVARGLASFRRYAGDRTVQQVVVDLVGAEKAAWPDDAEVVRLRGDAGWGAARNAALRRARGRLVLVADGSIEATGDVFEALETVLADPSVGVAGPFGIVTDDLREFRGSPGPEVDAIEGYLMAFRREVVDDEGLFDERFRFYRTADIECSFRLKDRGLRAVVVPLPVLRHVHRMWATTPPEERDRLSRRNFSRFLDRFRGRMDLTVRGSEPR